MKLLEICKKARDENWDDEKIELEILRTKQQFLKEILEEISK